MKNLAIFAAFMTAASAQAAPVTVTSLADFNTAIAGAPTSTETFDSDVAGGVSIAFANGTTSTLSGGSLAFAAVDNSVTGGVFQGLVDGDGSTGALFLTLDFGTPVIGFGADFTSGGNPSFPGADDNSGVEFSLDGGTTFFDLTDELGASEGFLGVIDLMSTFQTVLFRSSSIDSDEGSFGVDNLILANTTTEIPVPASALLLAAALGGLGIACRRRRRSI
ncbi:MAG: VPLPA-CTERM sorting domain-containing protein [Pseudomonadota bacterium]